MKGTYWSFQLNVDATVRSRLSYLGLTGAGLPAPGATPGSVFSGVPDGTGDSGITFLLY